MVLSSLPIWARIGTPLAAHDPRQQDGVGQALGDVGDHQRQPDAHDEPPDAVDGGDVVDAAGEPVDQCGDRPQA